MRIILAIVFAFFVMPGSILAHQPDGAQCAKEKEDDDRLLCYDLLFKKTIKIEPVKQGTGAWRIHKVISKIDDSQNVYLSLNSADYFSDRYNKKQQVILLIECRENTTVAYFNFSGSFMSDHAGNGRVTMRIDKQKAFNKNLRVSTDNEALGLWNGGSSIPLIKKLFAAGTLLLRFTPYNESSSTVNFPVTGLRNSIEPLAKACNWKP